MAGTCTVVSNGSYSTLTPDAPGDWTRNDSTWTVVFLDGESKTLLQYWVTNGQPLLIQPIVTYPFQLDFTTSGSTARQCDYRFTINPPPTGWTADMLNGAQVYLDGATTYSRTIVDSDANSFTLSDVPTVSATVEFDYYSRGGLAVQDDGTITPNATPKGWKPGQLVGAHIDICDGNGFTRQLTSATITENSGSTIKVNSPMPTWHGVGFTIDGATRLMTPAEPPANWFAGSQAYGFRNRTIQFLDADGNLQCSTSVDRIASSTTMYVYADQPLPAGTHSDWTWRIVDAFSGWGYIFKDVYPYLSGRPCTVNNKPVLNLVDFGSPSGLWPGALVGCNVSYDSGAGGTILANDAWSITLSYSSKSWGPRQWQLIVPSSGTGYVSADGKFHMVTGSPVNYYFPSALHNLPITIRGQSNTITSAEYSTILNLQHPVNIAHAFELPRHRSGDYFDVVAPGFSTVDQAQPYCYQMYQPADGFVSSQNGATVAWHNPLAVFAYTASAGFGYNSAANGGKCRLYFGPNANSYFELGIVQGGQNGTAVLSTPGGTVTRSFYAAWGSGWIASPVGVCVTKNDSGQYIIVATVPQSQLPQGQAVAGPLIAVVAASVWENAPHMVGLMGDNAVRFCPIITQEVRGTLNQPSNECVACSLACMIPGYPYGNAGWPTITLTLAGGTIPGTYVFHAPYGQCCFGASLPQPPGGYNWCSFGGGSPTAVYSLGAQIYDNGDGTGRLDLGVNRGCSGLECLGGGGCWYGGVHGTTNFSGAFSNRQLSLSNGAFCGATSATVSFGWTT